MFSIRLKELREKKGISQRELAKDLGVSQGTVGNWESATREPNFETVKRIAEYFGVSTDYILGTEVAKDGHVANPTDDEIKFALFGGTEGGDIEEAWDDVKGFVQFIRQKYNLDGKGDKGDS